MHPITPSNKPVAPASRNLMLENYDIKVPPFGVAKNAEGARKEATKIGGKDYVVKAQVLAEGPGKGRFSSGLQGGVQIVSTQDEVKEKAGLMLGANLIAKQTDKREKKCEEVMIIRRMFSKWVYHFSIFVDEQTTDAIITLIHHQKGVNIEEVAATNPEAIVKVPIDVNVGLTPDIAATIAKKLDIPQDCEEKAATIIEKLYKVFKRSDATLVEINPMAEDVNGKVYCMDCKLLLDSNAEFRQDKLFGLKDKKQEDRPKAVLNPTNSLPKSWKEELYSEHKPQPDEELKKQIDEVVYTVGRKFDLNIGRIEKSLNIRNSHTLINKMTISEICKRCAITQFDERIANTYDFGAIRSNIRKQAARCMDCGVPFCQGHFGCPLGNIIPKWNDYVFKKNWRQDLEQLLQTNNVPEFTGKVCPAPCEGACCLGIGSPAVTKSIECAVIDYAFMQGWMKPHKPNFNTGKRIAVIGSGPAGLAAASQLINVGHNVLIYEKSNRCGGLLRYGIPTTQIDKFVVDRRISLLEQEGVRFLTNTEIGKHVPADFLLKENDAVIVCTGSTTARDLTVEGRDAKGICFAMEFLEKSQRRRAGDEIAWEGLNPAGKKVIVLGGGDTVTDCIATSNRLGCQTVGAFEILPQPSEGRKPENPWPEWPLIFRTDYGHEEAKVLTGSDPRTYSVSTKRFLTSTNSAGVRVLTGLEIVNVEWEKDENGAWKLVEKADTLRVVEADLCILAMGFDASNGFRTRLNLTTDEHSNIVTTKDKYDSAVAKVFAAGDCRRGQSLVVWAIHEGHQAARQVDEYLMGKTILAGPGGIVTSNIVHKQAI